MDNPQDLNKSSPSLEDMAKKAEAIDAQNMRGILEDFYKQITDGYRLGAELKVSRMPDIGGILIAGMGGSALPGDILSSYMHDSRIPIVVSKDYTVPATVNSKTLVFAISYSGNTEETIEAYKESLSHNANVIAVTSGGKLEDLAKKDGRPLIKVAKGYQPRAAYGLMTMAIIAVLEKQGLLKDQEECAARTAETLKKYQKFEERADGIAEKLVNKVPLIYASTKMRAVAYKWKISFNENTKIHAFYNVFSELNHNEMVGFTNLNAQYHVIMIEDENDHPRVKKRMSILKKQIMGKGIDVSMIELEGRDELAKIMSAIYIGDWTSYLLAIKNGVDPTPVDMIEQFKKEMK